MTSDPYRIDRQETALPTPDESDDQLLAEAFEDWWAKAFPRAGRSSSTEIAHTAFCAGWRAAEPRIIDAHHADCGIECPHTFGWDRPKRP